LWKACQDHGVFRSNQFEISVIDSKNPERDVGTKPLHTFAYPAQAGRALTSIKRGLRKFRPPVVHALLFVFCLYAGPAATQIAQPNKAQVPALGFPALQETLPNETAMHGVVHLTAFFSAADHQPIREGLYWRVFEETPGPDGIHKLVAQSREATPNLPLPDGNFIVHAALGLAGATKRIAINGALLNETLILNAGGLRIAGLLGDKPINPAKLSIAIYVPEGSNPEAKLVANPKAGDLVGLPEGNYHVVSTLLDAAANGSASQTNSLISAELRIQAGKLTDATLRHRAATMTLKLVNSPGGEALTNTAFTILTPGGDVIREMIGAFPSATLAEGEYVAIARHDNKTYQSTFKVESGIQQDVEVVTRDSPPPAAP